MNQKAIIYQMFPRWFTNTVSDCKPNGDIEENGVGKMNDITENVLAKIKDLGITHVWYTGIIEHSQKTDYSKYGIKQDNPYVVKGKAGSPYAIKDYYDVDPDIAVSVPNRMHEFEDLVSRTHMAGMNVIIDFVPNHVSRQYSSDAKPAGVDDFGEKDNTDYNFAPNNNYYYISRQMFCPQINIGEGDEKYIEFPAKATGNDCFTAFPGEYDWYETVKLNYGVDYSNGSKHFKPIPDTWYKMLQILRFWASKGVDAFRCDMVFMVPIEFWTWAIAEVKSKFPNVKFIAEIYDVSLYRDFISRGGFDYLYDKVSLYDTLRGIQCSNVSAANITSCWQTVDGINSNMLNFLENHDEQRFASQQYAHDGSLVAASLVVSAMISTCPVMIYAGQELGEQANDAEGYSGNDGRTTIFDYWSVPTIRRWYNGGKCDGAHLSNKERALRSLYGRILTLCNKEKAISLGTFFDLMYVNYNNHSFNPHRQYAFIRRHKNETLIIIANFDGKSVNVGVNIPGHAFDILGIKAGEYKCTELLSERKESKTIDYTEPFLTSVPEYGAVIWKMTDKK